MKKLEIDFRTYTMFFALILIWVVFAAMTDRVFLSPRNISNLFVQMSVVGVLAIGMVLVIVSGSIDLSVGSVCAFIGAVAAVLCYNYNVPPIIAVLAALLVGVLIGVVQGSVTAYFRVPAFIVTLGGMMIYRGASMWILGGIDIQFMAGWVTKVGDGYLPDTFALAVAGIAAVACFYFPVRNRASRLKYGLDTATLPLTVLQSVFYVFMIGLFVFYMYGYKGIPISVFILLILVIIMTFIANRTRFGRHVYALGGNSEAAYLSGINVKLRIMQVFVVMGVLSAVAGIMLTSYVGSASQKAGGLKELDAIAACVIGGTSLMGGKGSIPGAILGALIMASLDNGLDLIGSAPAFRYVVKGVVLIVAVLIDMATQKDKS